MVPVIPISGWKGDNLIVPSTNMPWFKQWKATTPSGVEVKGKTLFEALDQFVEPVARGTDRPLRMPLSGIFKTKKGTVITGRIEQGVLVKQITTKTGANPQPVKFFPSGITAKIFSIEAHHRDQPNATAGDNIGVLLKGLPKGIQPKVGEVMCVHPEEKGANAIGKTKSFIVEVKIQEHPGKLKVGYCPLVLVRTAKSACKITKIHWKLTSQAMKNAAKDGKKSVKQMEDYKEQEPKFIQKGDLARITFEPSKESPISVSGFDDCEGLGRVAILESNSLVMMGKIKSVVSEEVKDRTG